MEPRSQTSARWTPLPKDFIQQVNEALIKSFTNQAKKGSFIIEGRIYPKELLVRIGFLEKGRLHQQNFEISIDYLPGKDDAYKTLGLAVDVGATMLEELFSSENDLDFPRLWQSFQIEGRDVYIQFSSINSRLETEAEKLLSLAEDRLVHEDDLLAEHSIFTEDEQRSLDGLSPYENSLLSSIKSNLGLGEDQEDLNPVPHDPYSTPHHSHEQIFPKNKKKH
ncbi:MAG: hypothetical protein K1X29_07110 [Bdellovibrionales bacterium]|nr:hypothetical protein [Bdellovibrionales bacterium]